MTCVASSRAAAVAFKVKPVIVISSGQIMTAIRREAEKKERWRRVRLAFRTTAAGGDHLLIVGTTAARPPAIITC